MATKAEILKTTEWVSVNIPGEYIDLILEAIKIQGKDGSVSEFVRDAIRDKLVKSKITAPKYDTIFERFEMISS
jgi:Arc/MetJ-type ribon-helix-helix transcriptional regulator